MEHFDLTQQGSSLRIEGFPDAVKVVALGGDRAKRLADLALHRADLDFAKHCLEEINLAPERPEITREALWRAAVIHFVKCFGETARFQLSAAKIYKSDSPGALTAFEWFKDLRNFHFIHDKNSYSQCIPGAVLNDGTKEYKIEKIVCVHAVASSLAQSHYGNLMLLITRAHEWVVAEFDAQCEHFTQVLEQEPYAALSAMPAMKFTPAKEDDRRKTRARP